MTRVDDYSSVVCIVNCKAPRQLPYLVHPDPEEAISQLGEVGTFAFFRGAPYVNHCIRSTMTAATEVPSLPPLNFEDHEPPSHHGLLEGFHPHTPDFHGAPKTATTKSLTDQTAQLIVAFKRDTFGSNHNGEAGKESMNGSGASIEDKAVTKILDGPHADDLDGGIDKHLQSGHRLSVRDDQRNSVKSLSTGPSPVANGSVSDAHNTGNMANLRGSSGSGKEESFREPLALQNGHTIVSSTPADQINPFHQLSFPDGSSPPWISKPLSNVDSAPNSDFALAPAVHIKRVSRDTVVLVPATPSADQIPPASGFSHGFMAQLSSHDQQLEIANGHLAIVENKEEKKAGFFGRFERAFTKGATTSGISHHASAPVGEHSEAVKPVAPADFLPQALSDHDANEVRGNAPPSPPISEPEIGSDVASVPLPQANVASLHTLSNPFQASASLRGSSAVARRSTSGSDAALSPRAVSGNLFLEQPLEGNAYARSISGQSFTTEPEMIEGVGETAQRYPLRRPSINTSTLEPPNTVTSDTSANNSPTNGTAPPADRNVVLAPPVLTGTTRSGSIAAIKRGMGKSSNGTASGRNSVTSASVVDADDRGVSPASLQAGGRRLSSDRHSYKGRSSLDQNSQNSLGLGIPSNSLQNISGSTIAPSQGLSLAPPAMPERRNTTGGPSSPRISTRSPLISSQSQLQVPLSPGGSQGVTGGLLGSRKRTMTDVPGLDGSALDPDILAEADRLRKERLNRRQRKKSGGEDEISRQDYETVAAGQVSAGDDVPAENSAGRFESHLKQKERQLAADLDRVLVGNLIGEDHVNYVLMYNMLTGIRIAVSRSRFVFEYRMPLTGGELQVSRCQAKMKRDVTEADYSAKHKYSFDM